MALTEQLPDTPQAPPIGTVIGGRYELVRFLGAGGMGAVYEARRPHLNRCAIKVLLRKAADGGDDNSRERFEREARVSGMVESPHIVPAIDAGVDRATGYPFMVMPLMVGLDLHALIRRLGPIHPAVAARILRQACRALVVAHDAGVVHRDIKPANIFLDHDTQGDITVRVLDFGVARWNADERKLTSTGSLVGTPHYMSPEQLTDSKSVDHRADVWSLGISLYRALAGTLPYSRSTGIADLLIAIATTDVPSLQDAAPWIEPGLAAVVHGTLIRPRHLRCPSVAAFAEALKPFTAGTDELSADMLDRVPEEIRSHRAPRAVIPKRWQDLPKEGPEGPCSTTVGRSADPMIGARLAGRYTLLRRLGRGGMGAVYDAVDDAGDRVAVKVIDLEAAGRREAVRKRFLREARAAAAIRSEHVVHVIEVDADPGSAVPFIVMELLQGTDLGAHVERHGPLTPSAAARLFVQACRGLSSAHAAGFVHRDIKPANLFLHELPSGEISLKICDFGIAKRLVNEGAPESSAAVTRTGGVVGSPMFMSPEQARSARDIDHRTDIWSLGCSLYEALAGVAPWQNRNTVGELIVAICTEPLPHVQDQAPWTPPALATVVHRCLRRSPEHRFASVEEVERALLEFTGGEATVLTTDLHPVTEDLRAVKEPRTSLPGPAATLSSAASLETAPSLPPARLNRWLLGAVAGGVVILGGALAVLTLGKRGVAEPAAPPDLDTSARPALTAPSTTSAESYQVEVTIKPATAAVRVGGEPQQLTGGRLTLRGLPGERFTVVVEQGNERVERDVVITRDGQPTPNTLALPDAPPASSSTAHAPARPPTPGKASASAASTAQPTATATGNAGVRPKDDW